ncbi:MAG: hypothetical protein ACRCS9_15610 [Hyphomicrobium sp.]
MALKLLAVGMLAIGISLMGDLDANDAMAAFILPGIAVIAIGALAKM